MNLSQAQAELMARGFDYLPAGRLTMMLNTAKNAFEDEWTWPWLEQTVTGPAPLAVNGLKHVLYVQDTSNDAELLGLDIRVLAQDGTPSDQPGTPVYWWLDGPTGAADTITIRTWPVGQTTLQARVLADSPELLNPDDAPLIPARYHSLWIDYAVVQAYYDSDNYSGAQALRAAIAVRIGDLIARYETSNRQHAVINSVRALHQDD